MAGALQEAFSNDSADGYVRQIIFITDGSVGNEDSLFSLIEKKKGKSRLFTVGIGAAPNSHFMQKAAESGQGTFTYISTQSDIKKGISDLFFKLKNPIMTNINITFDNISSVRDMEIFPKKIPDLYAGEPLIITAKLSSNAVKGGHSLSIDGSLNNQIFKQRVRIDTNKNSKSISRLWARKKLDGLYEKERNAIYKKGDDAQKNALKKQITNLAINHKLMSKYTSFLAIEEIISRPKNEQLSKEKIPNAMPEGSTQAIPMPASGLGILSLWYAFLICIFSIIALNVKNMFPRIINLQNRFSE